MMWNEQSSLYEMQKDIESILLHHMGQNVRMGEVIRLEKQDYYYLAKKLEQVGNVYEIETYALAILVGWVISYQYSRQTEYETKFCDKIRNLPQHQTKYILEVISTTFYEYQIDNFGYTFSYLGNLNELSKVIERHSSY